MAWLLRDGQVLASLEVAGSRVERLKGLTGRPGREGGLLLQKTKVAHSLGARFRLDVAFLDDEMTVIAMCRLRAHSASLPRLRATSVLEAEAGAFARWGLALGDHLELKE